MKYVEIEETGGKRKCHKCNATIPKNRRCLTITIWEKKVNICVYCFRDMFMTMVGVPFTNYTGRTNT